MGYSLGKHKYPTCLNAKRCNEIGDILRWFHICMLPFIIKLKVISYSLGQHNIQPVDKNWENIGMVLYLYVTVYNLNEGNKL